MADACRREMAPGSDPVVVAVDGHSAAGKSTFAVALSKLLSSSLVSGDDFSAVIDDDERARLSTAQGAERYYDCRRLRRMAMCMAGPILASRSTGEKFFGQSLQVGAHQAGVMIAVVGSDRTWGAYWKSDIGAV